MPHGVLALGGHEQQEDDLKGLLDDVFLEKAEVDTVLAGQCSLAGNPQGACSAEVASSDSLQTEELLMRLMVL